MRFWERKSRETTRKPGESIKYANGDKILQVFPNLKIHSAQVQEVRPSPPAASAAKHLTRRITPGSTTPPTLTGTPAQQRRAPPPHAPRSLAHAKAAGRRPRRPPRACAPLAAGAGAGAAGTACPLRARAEAFLLLLRWWNQRLSPGRRRRGRTRDANLC